MGIVYLLTLVDKPNSFKVDISENLNMNDIYFKYDQNVMIVFLYQINNHFVFNHFYNHIRALHDKFPYELGYFLGDYVSVSTVFLSTLVNIIPAKSPKIENFDRLFLREYQKEDVKTYFSECTEDTFFDGNKKLLHVIVKPIDDENLFFKFRFLDNNIIIMSFNTRFTLDKYGKSYFKSLFDKNILEDTKTYNMLDPTFQKSLKKQKKKHNNCVFENDVETLVKDSENSTNVFDIFHKVVSSDCVINGNYYVTVNEKIGKDFKISFSIDGKMKQFIMKKVDNIFVIGNLNDENKNSFESNKKNEIVDEIISNEEIDN